jgi:hypothetical protein
MVDGAIFKSADHLYSAYLTIIPGLPSPPPKKMTKHCYTANKATNIYYYVKNPGQTYGYGVSIIHQNRSEQSLNRHRETVENLHPYNRRRRTHVDAWNRN